MNYAKIYNWVIGLVSFILVAFPRYFSFALLAFILVVVFGKIKKKLVWNFSTASILFILFYIAYVIGIYFSIDKAHGFKYAEYKLAFLIFPIILSLKPTFDLKIKYPIVGLIAGIILVSGIGISNSLNCYSEHNWLLYCFSSSYVSPVHHPSYFSSFILFSITTMFFGKYKKWKGFNAYSTVTFVILALMMYLLCLSLAAILFLGIVLSVTFIIFFKRKFPAKKIIPISILSIILIGIVLINIPGIKEDIHKSTQSYSQIISDSDSFLQKRVEVEVVPGSEVRLIMWKVSIELILEYPFGVGTGSVDEYLRARLRKYGLHQMADKDFNPHNQYLQTALEIGFIGLLILLGLIFWCIGFAVKNKSYLLLLLTSSLAFHCLFESMFQRQSGISFYSFWIPLMVLEISMNKAKRSNSNTNKETFTEIDQFKPLR